MDTYGSGVLTSGAYDINITMLIYFDFLQVYIRTLYFCAHVCVKQDNCMCIKGKKIMWIVILKHQNLLIFPKNFCANINYPHLHSTCDFFPNFFYFKMCF
jgi:hypothetical protein